MKSKEYISFNKMIEYINKAMEYTKGYTFETFCNDDKTIDATVFAISQIGELVKNISNETMNKYNNIGLALAAYNAGMGRVDGWIKDGILKKDGSDLENIPFKETNLYVRKILYNYEKYKKTYYKK